MYRLEYRRAGDGHWLNSQNYPTIEVARAEVISFTNRASRDYVIRLRDDITDHIYWQLRPTRWWDDCPFENIDWNEPGLNLNPELTGEKINVITIGIRRIGGKLMLMVNAKEFHEELDKIGVQHNNTEYLDQPAASGAVANSTFQLSPKVLLRRDYKEVEYKDGTETKKAPVTGCFDLTGIWSTPPSFDQLKKLCNSAESVARKILEHYRPIDIAVEIHKKIVK